MSQGSKGDIGRRKFLKVAGGGAVTVGMAGCASQEPETEGGTTTESGTDETETETGTPGQRQELVNIANQVIGTIDPSKHTDYTEIAAVLNLYDPLINVDPDTNKPTSFIGTEWNVEDDGKTWVFKIKDGVPLHHGGTLDANDVAYTMKRNLRLKKGYSSLWQAVLTPEDVEVRNDREVAFHTSKTYGPFLATMVQLFILDSETVKENEQSGDFGDRGDYGQAYLKQNVAGSGPYAVKSWTSGSEMVFEKFEDYWKGWEEKQFDTARMKVITEESTTKTMMREGNADMTSQFLSTEAYEAMAGYDNVRVPEVPQLQLFHYPINCQKAPTDDINVRKALSYSFDYESAIENIIKGGVQAAGPVPAEMPGHNDSIEPYSFDLDKAKAALDKAEYSVEEINNMGLEIVHVANFPLERKIALLMSENLNKLGISNININPQQWATITQRASKAEETPHVTAIFHTAKFPSPDSHTFLMYHPSSFGTYISMSWYTTDELKQKLGTSRTM
ncbi:MAG: ABC transporter substrate-binding protein [Halobacteriaceae archaeon]